MKSVYHIHKDEDTGEYFVHNTATNDSVGLGVAAALGIDDVLSAGQDLSANRNIDCAGKDLKTNNTACNVHIFPYILKLGDTEHDNNSTKIVIDDTQQKIDISATERININSAKVGILGMVEYANNAAALAGGLIAGDLYYTNVAGDGVLKIVL